MGRPRIYTPEEAKKRKKESDKTSGKKRDERIKTDPEAKAKAKLKKIKYEAKIPIEQKREYNRIAKQRERAKKKSRVNANPSKVNQIKQLQIKVACEQAEEL